MPKNHGFIATVKLGPKGQIVIPKEVRDMFQIGPGDSLVLLADPKRGIGLQKPNVMLNLAQAILKGSGRTLYPEESDENLENFANLLTKEVTPDERDSDDQSV